MTASESHHSAEQILFALLTLWLMCAIIIVWGAFAFARWIQCKKVSRETKQEDAQASSR